MKKNKNKLEVFFYLAPSKISGVGLFTRIKIKKGLKLDKFITDDSVFIKNSPDIDLLNKLCVKVKNGWWCPSDFSRPSFWWYMNHSEKPNINCDKRNKFIVMENINPGEEITINYKNLDEKINNSDIEFINKKGPKNFYQ
ncbi:MAG: SET domain-containing protein [bacterium]|nr:SET domain-containing protein [bacterium]